MKTIYSVIDINRTDADGSAGGEAGQRAIAEAGSIIRRGGLVAFPTETVYGLGGDALNSTSSRKIYAAKGRPSDNPLIVHIADMDHLAPIVKKIPDAAYVLAEQFWPGPLTMIMEKSDLVPYETTGGLDTVAVRMPDHPVALSFIREAGGYIAAPSANTSGKPSPTTGKHVADDMNGKIDMILDGGAVGIGLESTIVDLTQDVPMILRPGYITQAMLSRVLGEVGVDRTILDAHSGQAPKAPGMKYKHYAPKGDLTIVEGDPEGVIAEINALTDRASAAGERVGVIGTRETVERYHADSVKCAGSRGDEASIAHNLYSILRAFDDEDVTVIFSESFTTLGMGQAIMNRLLKAAGHKVIEVSGTKPEGVNHNKGVRNMVAIGSDHGGFDLKQAIIQYFEENGIEYKDYGCYDKSSVDYPVYGKAVAHAVADGEAEKGIVVCTTGLGISMAANKVKGIRCAVCADTFSAKMTRLHNDANVLSLGGGIVGPNLGVEIVKTFLETEFSGEEKHSRRIAQLED